ncbi:MAG: T9SS type A sorting domain-containing protein [bacterium]
MWVTNFICIMIITQMRIDFTPNVRVDDDTLGWSQRMPSLAINPAGDTLYCVFRDNRYGFHDFPGLTLAKSSDRGATWSENLLIYYGEFDLESSMRIAVDHQGWLHVVFGFTSPGGVWYTKSTDGGYNWTFPVIISDTITTVPVNSVSFKADSNDNLYVMWHYFYEGVSNDYDIFFTRSMDHGATWLHPNIIVNDTVSCMNQYPSFCFGGHDTVYVVWQDNRLPICQILFSRSTDAGITWLDSNIKINPDSNLCNLYPRIAPSNNILYCVWTECPGWTGCLKSAKSTNAGDTWSQPVVISDSFVRQKGLLAFDVDTIGNLYVVWPDSRQDTSDIFFSYSSDSGNTWYSPSIRVNDDTTQRPQSFVDILANGPDDIYVVWADARADTFTHPYPGPDIYFARGSIISSLNEKQSCKSNDVNLQILPNPFSRLTHISLSSIQTIYYSKLEIYSITGALIKSFENSGDHQSLSSKIVWDGTNSQGFKVPAGVYYIILKLSNRCIAKKVVFIK